MHILKLLSLKIENVFEFSADKKVFNINVADVFREKYVWLNNNNKNV